jgi:hypothetical protein
MLQTAQLRETRRDVAQDRRQTDHVLIDVAQITIVNSTEMRLPSAVIAGTESSSPAL